MLALLSFICHPLIQYSRRRHERRAENKGERVADNSSRKLETGLEDGAVEPVSAANDRNRLDGDAIGVACKLGRMGIELDTTVHLTPIVKPRFHFWN